MKTILFAFFLIVIMIGCKSSDPAPTATGGCTVQFKGATHTLNIAFCTDGTTVGMPGVDGLSASETSGNKGLVIARDASDPTSNSVSFSLDLTSGNAYVAAEGITSQPTINRSGKSWSFSGTASNGTESASISGNCTCTN